MSICFYLYFERRSQIKQTLKKKAFEDAGIPVKQISMVQVQPPTHVAQVAHAETVYIKSEPELLSSIPSTSTTILIPASLEPPNELIISDIKDEQSIQLGTHIGTTDELNLLTNTDEALLSSDDTLLDTPLTEDSDDSIDLHEVKMEEVVSG